MTEQIVSQVDQRINEYLKAHPGQKPLFILMTEEEADLLTTAIRNKNGYNDKVMITEYNGIKIVRDPALKNGQLLLTNELPETSS
ncbi:MAG TPA: hypothetical protein VD927_05295 [Chryseosolibacter sp.]|nr:hypothetical protein [Chryseosolibacter sp.]